MNVYLLESHRADASASVFVATPRIEPPRVIPGPSSHAIPPRGDVC
jgi:hypothetical protein